MKKIQDFFPIKVPLSLESFYETFVDDPKKQTTYIVATSGGSDSLMALFTLYSFLSQKTILGITATIVVVHCNHKTRKETDQEEALVMSYLDEHVEYRGFRYREKGGTEADLRKWRWSCLEKVVQEKTLRPSVEEQGDYEIVVVTGHHLDDRIETSLLNLDRGCGLWGLGNMERKTKTVVRSASGTLNYTTIRPLLVLTKEAVVSWCEGMKITYVVDETNFDRRGGKRSIMRHFVQGKLSIDPLWSDTRESLYHQISTYKERLSQSYVLDPVGLSTHRSLDWGYERKLGVQRNLLTFDLVVSLLHAVGVYRNMTTSGLSELVFFLGSGTSGFRLLGNVMFVIAHDSIYVFGGEVIVNGAPFWDVKPIAKPCPLDRVGEYQYGDHSFVVDDSQLGGVMRYIKESDTYHGKNIKKYLLNQKVPIFLRNTTVVLEKDMRILSVFC